MEALEVEEVQQELEAPLLKLARPPLLATDLVVAQEQLPVRLSRVAEVELELQALMEVRLQVTEMEV
jgi:hypothetical protein